MANVMINQFHPLKVFRASAGSGKTFILAVKYIELLINDPYCYRNILAVTFTNKAAGEMKTRILSQLYGLWQNLPGSMNYKKKICEDLSIDDFTLSKKSGAALISILHNFTFFHVETIDTFFQRIMRNLARELDLTANLRIDMNQDEIKDEAVESLINNLDEKNKVMQWLIDYVMQNIADDKGWNVIRNIKNFSKKIFQEEYKRHSDEIRTAYEDDANFTDIYNEIKNRERIAKAAIQKLCDQFDSAFSSSPGDDKDMNTVPKTFFRDLRLLKFGDINKLSKYLEAESWYKKKSLYADEIKNYAQQSLVPIVQQLLEELPAIKKQYLSANLTLAHLNEMRLLNHIEKTMRVENAETNRFMISDTPFIIDTLIKDSDAPFVFEKIGSSLEHIMIDEFQDTSKIQWGNFKKLLNESISRSSKDDSNIIVGDVKQSIYRWRSGDWRLLNGIVKEFTGNGVVDNGVVKTESLNFNYRSLPGIVHFNNAFFSEAVTVTSDEMTVAHIPQSDIDEFTAAYSDVVQKCPRDHSGVKQPDDTSDTGLVNIKIYPKKSNSAALTNKDEQLAEVLNIVNDLMYRGIDPDNIGILVRTNDDARRIVDYFSQNAPSVSIVSNEAFLLDSSMSVNMIVSAMYELFHPDDLLTRAFIAKAYQTLVLSDVVSDNDIFTGDLNSFLPKEYVEGAESLKQESLYEMAEKIYHLFSLNTLEGQNAYVCALFDEIDNFVTNYTSDIEQFMEQWKTSIHKKQIQSDAVHGVSIYTIHKSKGLEFDNVIIPFCDWRLEKTMGNTVWCTPKEEIYNRLGLVSVNYKSDMMDSIYADDYLEESFQNRVDNLNLLYVAFTRAKHNLFILGNEGTSMSRSALILKCLSSVVDKLNSAEYAPISKERPATFTYGSLYVKEKDDIDNDKETEKGNKGNVFLQKPAAIDVDLEMYDSDAVKYNQSNQSREFMIGDDEHADMIKRQRGILFHSLLSTIRTADDVDNAIRQFEIDGKLSTSLLSSSSLKQTFSNAMKTPMVSDWFSHRWQLFNECSILFTNNDGKNEHRQPDRVMVDGDKVVVVDFKTGEYNGKYKRQVQEYMNLLLGMGYKNVHGYVWYIETNQIDNA